MLTLVATPIGNLEDISYRALKALKESDAVLCEDKRRSSVLLNHFEIERPLIAYHQFNEAKSQEKILSDLAAGKRFCLISDAGTPLISDPGHRLVSGCIERNIPFTAVPGPCSPILALVLSGFDCERFQFAGFLSKNPEKELRSFLFYPGTTVLFESPERILRTLKILASLDPKRPLALAREMTKVFEECRRGSAKDLLEHVQKEKTKGEIVLVIGEAPPPEDPLGPEECVSLLQESLGLSLKEAIHSAARLTKTNKRELYRQIHQE